MCPTALQVGLGDVKPCLAHTPQLEISNFTEISREICPRVCEICDVEFALATNEILTWAKRKPSRSPAVGMGVARQGLQRARVAHTGRFG